MSPLIRFESRIVRNCRGILCTLESDLALAYRETLEYLQESAVEPSRVEGLGDSIHTLATLGSEVRELKAGVGFENLASVGDRLIYQTQRTIRSLELEPPAHHEARRILTCAMQLLMGAEYKFSGQLKHAEIPEAEDAVRDVQISSDLLHQCQQSLFPAERMVVIAGRARRKGVELGATFDVTGTASAGHVRADPYKLSQALIVMSATGTYLAAWFHSHPGSGTGSTYPSHTDLKQHADWLKDYSPRLLSGIFVHDCHVRFWGSGLEGGLIRLNLEGPGVVPEGEDGYVYRVVTS